MNWLPWPIIPNRQWPAVVYGVKRAITWPEHLAILEREKNPERKAFYRLAWHLGTSQSDLASLRAEDRATEFKQRCRGLGIAGVSLHSYRYAWAERARTCGYPERFAQEALGHNSKAVHRAYAKRATVKIPSLDEFERKAQ